MRSIRRRLRDGGRWTGKHLGTELAAGKREGADVVDETGEVLKEVLGAVARRADQETPSRISIAMAFDEEAIGAIVAHRGSVERAMLPAASRCLAPTQNLPRTPTVQTAPYSWLLSRSPGSFTKDRMGAFVMLRPLRVTS